MRITVVNQYYPPDLAPTGQLAASLAQHRAARGDEVTVLTSSARYAASGPTAADAAPPSGAARGLGEPRVVRVSGARLAATSILARARQYIAFYRGVSRQLKRLPPQDVVIALTTPPYIARLCVRHKRRHPATRLILWHMDAYPDILEAAGLIRPGGWTARLLARGTRRLLGQVDHVVCLDQAMRELVERSYAPPGLPISVIPNWERAELFPDDDPPPPWPARERLRLAGRFVLLYMGNAGWGHAFRTVLEAAEQLRDEPVTLLFVGGGSQHGPLAAEVARRGLEHVVFHPYVPESERRSVLASADLALVTLDERALGVMSPSKLHACLAMRLPVLYVGPAGSNVDEAIARFGCGLSLREDQPARIAQLLRELRADPRRLAELRQRARQAFDAAYCDRQTLAQFDAVISSLHPAPPPITGPTEPAIGAGPRSSPR